MVALATSPDALDAFFLSKDNVGKGLATLASLNHATFDPLKSMSAVAASSTAMNAVTASTIALNAIVASNTAMSAVAASAVAMNIISASTTAMNAVVASSAAMNAVAASSTAMNVIAASSKALTIIWSSKNYTIIEDSQVAYTALSNSSLVKTIVTWQAAPFGSTTNAEANGSTKFILISMNQKKYNFGIDNRYISVFGTTLADGTVTLIMDSSTYNNYIKTFKFMKSLVPVSNNWGASYFSTNEFVGYKVIEL